MKHHHKWKHCAWSGQKIEFYCSGCKERCHRPMTATERKYFNKHDRFRLHPTPKGLPQAKYQPDIHSVWRSFENRFMKLKRSTFVITGYRLMVAVEKWAKKFPHEVQIVRCDDAHFCGSNIVLIEHRTRSQYMGTSAVYIPQCTGESPIQFFLYPSHRKAFIDALKHISSAEKPIKKAQRLYERARYKFWSRSKPGPNAIPGGM